MVLLEQPAGGGGQGQREYCGGLVRHGGGDGCGQVGEDDGVGLEGPFGCAVALLVCSHRMGQNTVTDAKAGDR